MQMTARQISLLFTFSLLYACGLKKNGNRIEKAKPIRMIQLDPTHSHAAAAQNEVAVKVCCCQLHQWHKHGTQRSSRCD